MAITRTDVAEYPENCPHGYAEGAECIKCGGVARVPIPEARVVVPRRVPIPILLPSSKRTPAAAFTYTFLDLGGPPNMGLIWDVLRYAITGDDPFTAVAGAVIAFVGANAWQDRNDLPAFPNLVDTAGAIPNVASWAPHQLAIHWPNHLMLCLKGLPNATQVTGTIQAAQYLKSDYTAGTA